MKLQDIRNIALTEGTKNKTIRALCVELLNVHEINTRICGDIADLIRENAELRGDTPYQVDDSDILPAITAPAVIRVGPKCNDCGTSVLDNGASTFCSCDPVTP